MASTITRMLFVLSIGVLWAGRAFAQSNEERDTATARALFREGVELSDLGDLQGAADRFRRSLEIRPSPVVEYNLGSTLVELGRLVEASEHLTHVLQHFAQNPGTNQRVHQAARALQARIAARIARLTIEVTGFSEGDEVRIDGVRHPEQALGVGAPADPGPHRITVHRNETELAGEDIELAEGANESVALEVPANHPAPPDLRPDPVLTPPLVEPDPVVDVDEGGGVAESPWFWLAIGSGVAAIAMVVVILSMNAGEEPPFDGSLTPGTLEL
jgi:hypothetical protein